MAQTAQCPHSSTEAEGDEVKRSEAEILETLARQFDFYAVDLAKDMLVMMSGFPEFGKNRIKYFEGRISFLEELRDTRKRLAEQKESA